MALPTRVLLCSQREWNSAGFGKMPVPGGPLSYLRSQENKVQISDQALVSALPSSL